MRGISIDILFLSPLTAFSEGVGGWWSSSQMITWKAMNVIFRPNLLSVFPQVRSQALYLKLPVSIITGTAVTSEAVAEVSAVP